MGPYWGYTGVIWDNGKPKPMINKPPPFRVILGLYWDNGKENGKYCNGLYIYIYIWVILGLYRDNGKENGSYCLGFRV